jgi:hypothetical protein
MAIFIRQFRRTSGVPLEQGAGDGGVMGRRIGTPNIMFDDYRGKLVDPIDENSVQSSSVPFYPIH